MLRSQMRTGAIQVDGGVASKELCIILPALNEERSIGQVIRRIPRESLRVLGYSPRVVVVDGRSKDSTLAIARAKGAETVIQDGKGKGDALRQVHEALREEARSQTPPPLTQRCYVVLDADGTYPPETITDLVAALDSGYDLVLGSRFMGIIHPGAMTRLNRIGNRFLTQLFRILNGVDITDVCTGMYAFNERVFENLSLQADGFDVEADLFTSASLMNARFAEVPVDYSRRLGEPKLVPLRSGIQIGTRMFLRRVHSMGSHSKLQERPSRPLHPFLAWAERLRDPHSARRRRAVRSRWALGGLLTFLAPSDPSHSRREGFRED